MPSDKKVLLRITGTTGAGGGQDCHVFPPGRGTCSFRDRTVTLVKIEVLVLAEVWPLVESRTGPLRWRWTRAADSKPKSESARSPWSHPWNWQHHREGDPLWQGSFSGKRCIPDHSPSGRSCQFHCRLCYLSSSRLILCNRKERLPLKRSHPPPPLLGPALRRGDIAAWGRCLKELWALWMPFAVLRHAARHVAGPHWCQLDNNIGTSRWPLSRTCKQFEQRDFIMMIEGWWKPIRFISYQTDIYPSWWGHRNQFAKHEIYFG